MNIAIYISPRHTVPSKDDRRSMPWDTAQYLADGLAAKGTAIGRLFGIGGHTVYLFAARQSKTKARHFHFDIDAVDRSRESLSPAAYRSAVADAESRMFIRMMQTAIQKHIDIIHVLDPAESLTDVIRTAKSTIPVVVTIQDLITSDRLEALKSLSAIPGVYLVATSTAQRDGFPLPFYETIYNGVDSVSHPFHRGSGEAFIMTGRVSAEKGFDDALKAVSKNGAQLKIAGKIYQHLMTDDSYFRVRLAPQLSANGVVMQQFLSRPELIEFYSDARALLYPVLWDEPYGISVIEAMMCGTPVIAYNRGFIPEVIRDGVTGFIVQSPEVIQGQRNTYEIQQSGVDGLVEAMSRIRNINRIDCRKHAEENFSAAVMVKAYESLYAKITKNGANVR